MKFNSLVWVKKQRNVFTPLWTWITTPSYLASTRTEHNVAFPLFSTQTSLGVVPFRLGFHRYKSASRNILLHYAAVIMVGSYT